MVLKHWQKEQRLLITKHTLQSIMFEVSTLGAHKFSKCNIPAGVQNPEIRKDLSVGCGVLSLITELLSIGFLLLESELKPLRLRFPIKSPGR